MKCDLLNIDLKLIPNSVIIKLAKDLGCDFKEPSRIENKYSKCILDKLMKGETKIDEDLFTAEMNENKVIEKNYKEDCSIYFDDILWWLEDKGYLRYV